MSASATIFHVQPFGLCHGGYGVSEFGQPTPHATQVVCWVCRRNGFIPEVGHELEFMAPGTVRTSYGFAWYPPGTEPMDALDRNRHNTVTLGFSIDLAGRLLREADGDEGYCQALVEYVAASYGIKEQTVLERLIRESSADPFGDPGTRTLGRHQRDYPATSNPGPEPVNPARRVETVKTESLGG